MTANRTSIRGLTRRLTLGVLLAMGAGAFVALVALLLSAVAAYAVLLQTIQAENMSESSASVAPFTGVEGVTMMRWSSGATTSAVASTSISPSQPVDQIAVQTRQASGGTGVMAIVVDGSVVGTFRPGTSGFAPVTVNLTNAISAQQHTLVLRPNATLPARLDVDYVELHNSGDTAPAQCADNQDNDGDGLVDLNDPGCSSSSDDEETNAPTGDTEAPTTSITSGPAAGSTDTDGNVSFGYSGQDNVGVAGFETRLITPTNSNPVWVDQGTSTSVSYNGLANGSYTFEVRAYDAAGNRDASPAQRQFRVSVSSGGTCTGTQVNPTNNLENIIDNPGNYCLRGGVYQESDKQITINADNVTLRNVPGERVEIRGRVRTNDGASNVRFIGTDVSPDVEGIKFDNSYAPVSWSTSGGMGHFTADPHLIRGSGTVFDNVEITASNDVLGDPWYSSKLSTPARAIGTCVLIADGTDGVQAADVRIANSDIHNCGAKPDARAENVGTHALYLSGALRAQIEHNMIYGGATRGVQMRNNTDNSHVYGNVIDGNYVGIGHDDPSTTGNISENNVVTRNENKNIRNLSDAGSNTVRDNCGYGVAIPNGQDGNVSYSNNVNVSTLPYSVQPSPTADAVVSNSTCAAKLPADSRFRQ